MAITRFSKRLVLNAVKLFLQGEMYERYQKAYFSKIQEFEEAEVKAQEYSEQVYHKCQQELLDQIERMAQSYEATRRQIELEQEQALASIKKREEAFELERQKEIQNLQEAKKEDLRRAEEKRLQEQMQSNLLAEQKHQQQQIDLAKKAEAEAKEKAQKQEQELNIKAAEELKKKNDAKVIPELEGLILKPDVERQEKYLDLLCKYEQATEHLTNAQKGSREKQYLFTAMKAINVPLNALTSVSSNMVQSKVQHFVRLLSGETVNVDSNNTRFNPNGKFYTNIAIFSHV